jgi:hypothetical protein
VTNDGTQKFYFKSKLHRDGDQPAVVHPDGTVEFYKNGRRHRDGELPAIIRANGALRYYVDGRRVPAPKKVKKAVVAPVIKSVTSAEVPKIQAEISRPTLTFQDIQAFEKYSNPEFDRMKARGLEPALN